jgi:hypothetical protein
VERHQASHAGIRASLMIMETVKIVATCLWRGCMKQSGMTSIATPSIHTYVNLNNPDVSI